MEQLRQIGEFSVKAWISANAVISSDDIQDGTVMTGNFPAGFAVEDVPGASTIPSTLPAGTYYLILKADADNQVTEGNESNNIVSGIFTVTNNSNTNGDCETDFADGNFICAEENGTGGLEVVYDNGGLRSKSTIDADGQVLNNQDIGSTPGNINEYISGNKLTRSVNGTIVFEAELPANLLDEYDSFQTWTEYNGGFAIFAYRNFNPPVSTILDSLYVIHTDVSMNVISLKYIPDFEGPVQGTYIRSPKQVSPDRVAFISFKGNSTPYSMSLVVIDEQFEVLSERNLYSSFYAGSAEILASDCGGWAVNTNIGLSFCGHGACYISERRWGDFIGDSYVVNATSQSSESSTYGFGTKNKLWSAGNVVGTVYTASLVQQIPVTTGGLNNTVTIVKSTGGTFVWEKQVTVPDAIKVAAIRKVGLELVFLQEDGGVLSSINVSCLEDSPPPPGGVDLELEMSTNNSSPSIYSSVELNLTVSNTGDEAASGIVVDFARPDGTVYTGGNEWTATQGFFNPHGNEQWTVGDLAAGESATITVSYFLLSANALTPFAEVFSMNELDSDSTPGNGTCCTPNEDDEATVLLNGFAGGSGALQMPELIGRDIQLKAVNPNPVYHGKVEVTLLSRVEGIYDLEIYDLLGRLALVQKIELQEGRNEIPLDVSNFRSGTYYLNMPGQNWRNMPLRFVVARW